MPNHGQGPIPLEVSLSSQSGFQISLRLEMLACRGLEQCQESILLRRGLQYGFWSGHVKYFLVLNLPKDRVVLLVVLHRRVAASECLQGEPDRIESRVLAIVRHDKNAGVKPQFAQWLFERFWWHCKVVASQ